MTTPRARRRQQTVEEILDAAWTLARRDGLAALSMRELGRMVGMRAQSLYGYFDSKASLYDAMFRQGLEDRRRLEADWRDRLEHSHDRRALAKELMGEFARWCADDPVRFQLLHQRTLPGWEPSPESYALAVAELEELRAALAVLGMDRPGALDLWTAVLSGLISQQISNEPGGDRWIRLIPEAVDMLFDHLARDDQQEAP